MYRLGGTAEPGVYLSLGSDVPGEYLSVESAVDGRYNGAICTSAFPPDHDHTGPSPSHPSY